MGTMTDSDWGLRKAGMMDFHSACQMVASTGTTMGSHLGLSKAAMTDFHLGHWRDASTEITRVAHSGLWRVEMMAKRTGSHLEHLKAAMKVTRMGFRLGCLRVPMMGFDWDYPKVEKMDSHLVHLTAEKKETMRGSHLGLRRVPLRDSGSDL